MLIAPARKALTFVGGVAGASTKRGQFNGAVYTAPPFSVSIRFRSTDVGSSKTVLFCILASSSAYHGWFLGRKDDNVYLESNGAANSQVFGGQFIAGQWCTALFVEAGIADHRVYCTGKTASGTTSVTPSMGGTLRTTIGCYNMGDSDISGAVDAVVGRVCTWGAALTADDADDLRNGRDELEICPEGLNNVWDPTEGTTLPNLIAASRDMSVLNAPTIVDDTSDFLNRSPFIWMPTSPPPPPANTSYLPLLGVGA